MDQAHIPLSAFAEKIRRHVDPASPPPLRMMGARGLVPAAPEELIPMLVQLGFDAEPSIAETAQKTLREMPTDLVRVAAAFPGLHTAALDRLAHVHLRHQDVLEAVLRNAQTSDATYIWVAKHCSESITELIAANEVRILRCPGIIEGLFLNEQARASTIDRLIELARRHKLTFEGLPALQSIVEDMRYDAQAAAQQTALDDHIFRQLLAESRAEEEKLAREEQALSEEEQIRRRELEQEKLDAEAEGVVAEEGNAPGSNNKAAAIGKMNIAQKVRLATLGARSDRDLLIRDGNRLVHMAAVTSPKNQLKDIVAWSANKQLPDNVIVYIANNGKFKRNYTILINLTNNPKTPLNESVRLMQNLQAKDLAALIKNRNISGNLRRMAQALRDQRTQKRG